MQRGRSSRDLPPCIQRMPWAAQFPLHLIYCFSSLVFPPPLGFPLLPPSPCLAWLLLAAKIQGDAGILQCPAWSISLPRASSCPRRPARPQNGAVKRIKSKYLSIKSAVKHKVSSKRFSRENMCCVSNPPGSYHSQIILYTHTYRYLYLIMLQSPQHSLETFVFGKEKHIVVSRGTECSAVHPGW